VNIQFVSLSESKFFGFGEAEVMGEKVQMADPEKALLDSLDKPQYAGGIEEVCAAFVKAKAQIDSGKLCDYAPELGTISLVQRLGFLIDFLKLSVPGKIRRKLVGLVKENAQPIPLASPARFGRKGKLSEDWLVIQNVPEKLLRAN
jgi:predicted transcriptional regulator of viral defense system